MHGRLSGTAWGFRMRLTDCARVLPAIERWARSRELLDCGGRAPYFDGCGSRLRAGIPQDGRGPPPPTRPRQLYPLVGGIIMGRWIRLDTSWSSSEWLAALEPIPRLLWPELLCYVKAHGIAGRCRRGVDALRRVTGVTRNDVTDLETAAIEHGALTLDDGDWVLTGWRKYQGDDTAPERMRRHREASKQLSPLRQLRVTEGALRSVTDVTPTVTETVTVVKKKPPSSVSKKAASWRFCPEDFQPTDSHRLLARQLVVNLDVELAKFRDHEYAKPKTDAGRAFSTWLRNSATYRANGNERHAVHEQHDPRTLNPFKNRA